MMMMMMTMMKMMMMMIKVMMIMMMTMMTTILVKEDLAKGRSSPRAHFKARVKKNMFLLSTFCG